MDEINIRYGEDITLPIDTNNPDAVSATLYVGKAGETPKITTTISLVGGNGIFELTSTDTSIPLGEYKYQVNVTNENDQVEKYPNPDDCGEDGLPIFNVFEALDVTEVVS